MSGFMEFIGRMLLSAPASREQHLVALEAGIADGCAAQAERRKRKAASYRSHRFERARPKVEQLRAEMGR